MIASIGNLSKELKLSENIIRNTLNKLKKTGYIITKGTNKYTRIKIMESNIYTENKITNNEQNNNQITNQEQTKNNQITTTNKVKNEKTLEERKEIFKNEIFKHKDNYTESFLKSFFNCWSEENKQTRRLKFEDEKYWNLSNRLTSWKEFKPEPKKPTFIKNR